MPIVCGSGSGGGGGSVCWGGTGKSAASRERTSEDDVLVVMVNDSRADSGFLGLGSGEFSSTRVSGEKEGGGSVCGEELLG